MAILTERLGVRNVQEMPVIKVGRGGDFGLEDTKDANATGEVKKTTQEIAPSAFKRVVQRGTGLSPEDMDTIEKDMKKMGMSDEQIKAAIEHRAKDVRPTKGEVTTFRQAGTPKKKD
ncbi:hypothetical protein HYT59_00080 [Candidatus Woesebacteria bacterium]|nr:hypothetical protein [Candidatus Woesebacteria bacterium]